MVIEWLKFKVPPEHREQYVQVDEAVWNPFLASSDGFLSKEVWINPNEPDEVILVIHWASRDAWKAIPADRLKQVEQEFDRTFGHPYEMVESSEFQVRKFPQRSS